MLAMKQDNKETECHIDIQIIISKPYQWAMMELPVRSHVKNPVSGPWKQENSSKKQIGECTNHFLPNRECFVYTGKT